jgi:fatty acid desaturase
MVSASPVATGAAPLAPPDLQALHQSDPRYLWRIALFVGLYALAVAVIANLIQQFPAAWPLRLPFYLLAAASLHGISLFTHEGVHGVLHPHPLTNRLLSAACALPVLQNFAAYRVLHLQHHAHLGQVGDPDHYRNYTHWTKLEFLMYWGRLLVGYPVYVVMIPILGWQEGKGADRQCIAAELGLLIATAIGIWKLGLPTALLIHGWLIPMVIINTIVNIRGMSQHTLLEHEQDPVRGSRTLLCGPITRFFMCNENYHLEHHLYPGVPWYNLPKLHQALHQSLLDQGATYLPSYLAFVQEFAIASLARTSFGSIKIVN